MAKKQTTTINWRAGDAAARLYPRWIAAARAAEAAGERSHKLYDRYPAFLEVKLLCPLHLGGYRETTTVTREKDIDDLVCSDHEKARLRIKLRKILAARKHSGYAAAYDEWNRLSRRAQKLAECVVKAKATTPAGWSAKLETFLFEGEIHDDWLADNIGKVCHEMRIAAGGES